MLIGICTLNEAANIVPLITGLRSALPEADVLVVDDNSPDNTASLVARITARDPAVTLLVRHDQRGLGSALRCAMAYAIARGYIYFLNLDGDLSHDPAQLPALLQRAIDAPELDVVIGSRYIQGGSIVGWPLHRRWMSRLVNQFAKRCLGLPVNDCSGSMRCYRLAALDRIGMERVRVDGYAVLEELLVLLHRQGSKMAEVPITFTDRRQGRSKLTGTEAIRSTRQMLSLAWHRQRS